MFKIDYKVVYDGCLASDVYFDYYAEIEDYFDAIDTVYGDILITVNNSRYGYIFDVPSKTDPEDTYGDTVLDVWFNKLLEACTELYSGTEYKIKEPECSDVFLSLKKNERGDLYVSYLSGGKTNWTEIISYKEFADEVLYKTKMFIDDLCEYNERIAYSPVVTWLAEKLEKLEKDM